MTDPMTAPEEPLPCPFCHGLNTSCPDGCDFLSRPDHGVGVGELEAVLDVIDSLYRKYAIWLDAKDMAIVRHARQVSLTALRAPDHGWPIGQRVTKSKGSKWTGKIVGHYATELTPEGYAVESETETGSVQIYPRAALIPLPPKDQARG